jgi:hypothetical protein
MNARKPTVRRRSFVFRHFVSLGSERKVNGARFRLRTNDAQSRQPQKGTKDLEQRSRNQRLMNALSFGEESNGLDKPISSRRAR